MLLKWSNYYRIMRCVHGYFAPSFGQLDGFNLNLDHIELESFTNIFFYWGIMIKFIKIWKTVHREKAKIDSQSKGKLSDKFKEFPIKRSILDTYDFDKALASSFQCRRICANSVDVVDINHMISFTIGSISMVVEIPLVPFYSNERILSH